MSDKPRFLELRHPASPGLSLTILLAGLIILALGIWLGETEIVLNKATQVCLQCIGIG